MNQTPIVILKKCVNYKTEGESKFGCLNTRTKKYLQIVNVKMYVILQLVNVAYANLDSLETSAKVNKNS